MNLINYLLKGGNVFFEEGFKQVDMRIANGKVVEIGADLTAEHIIDCVGTIITPGFIDAHVHLRDPGFTYKEDIKTGTMAAIRGGFTTVLAMPNTNPVIDTADKVAAFMEKVKTDASCEVKTFVALSHGLQGEELTDIEALATLPIAGFSDDGKGLQNDDKMRAQMQRIKTVDQIVSIHCEDEKELTTPMGCVNLGEVSERLGLIGINNASEANMLLRDLKLNEEIGIKYHMCHISTKESVEIIRAYKAQGMSVTAEVTPHHLCLNETQISMKDPNFKMNPPLRSESDQASLIAALNDGTITIIATDHAPHASEEKAKGIEEAPFGIIGLEQAFSVLYTYLIKTNKVKLETILNAMTYAPAKRFNIKRGFQIGDEINATIINLNEKRLYNRETTASKAINTPFNNMKLDGKIKMTIIGGRVHEWNN